MQRDYEARRGGPLEAEMQHDPTLDELLDEPIIRLLMASHGVTAAEIRRLMDDARKRRGPAANSGHEPSRQTWCDLALAC